MSANPMPADSTKYAPMITQSRSCITASLRRVDDCFRERAPEKALSATELWPPELRARYPNVPASLTEFLGRIDRCENAGETAWFLTAADYAGTADSAWAWNEWERQGL